MDLTVLFTLTGAAYVAALCSLAVVLILRARRHRNSVTENQEES